MDTDIGSAYLSLRELADGNSGMAAGSHGRLGGRTWVPVDTGGRLRVSLTWCPLYTMLA
jgi:hypothetical protein